MKTQLFNDLILLFKQQFGDFSKPSSAAHPTALLDNLEASAAQENAYQVIKEASPNAIRVFTEHERVRFTKASHQFLVRLNKMGVFSADYVEKLIHHLLVCGPNLLSLSETKGLVREFIQQELTDHQLLFLDLVPYQKEDRVSIQ